MHSQIRFITSFGGQFVVFLLNFMIEINWKICQFIELCYSQLVRKIFIYLVLSSKVPTCLND